MGHNQKFWSVVGEECTVSEPLVKVIRLVDGDRPAMGYLYEAMDRAKETIHHYYEDKGEVGLTRRAELWSVIDERWNNTLHHPIYAQGSTSTLLSLMHVDFSLMLRSWMAFSNVFKGWC